jgi:hypothetical protein
MSFGGSIGGSIGANLGDNIANAAGIGLGAANTLATVGGTAATLVLQQREAKTARKFARRAAATAWQRTVRDMQLAGINPMFAATAGATPVGAAAIAKLPDLGQGVANAVSNENARTIAQSRAATEAEQRNLIRGQSLTQDALTREHNANATLAESLIPGARVRNAFDSSSLGRELIRAQRLTELGGSTAGNVLAPIGHLFGGAAQGLLKGLGTNYGKGKAFDAQVRRLRKAIRAGGSTLSSQGRP